MSPPVAATGSLSGALGCPPQREVKNWGAVVVRHARDDWPPPGWVSVIAESGSDPHEAPVLLVPAEERAA